MSTLPKLTYFNGAGRVFALRVAMYKAFGKDGWVDHRVEFKDWAELKPSTPLGSLPVLTLADGTTLVQAEAMARWAGKKAGLYPEDPTAALVTDVITASVMEVLTKTPPAAGDEGKAKREEYAAGFMSKVRSTGFQQMSHRCQHTCAEMRLLKRVLRKR